MALLVILALMAGLCGSIQTQNSKREEKAIDALMLEALGCLKIPGLSLTLVRNGHVILAKGYGVKDYNSQELVTNTTMFSIGSLTKAFASTLLAKQLYELGYDLETPLTSVEGFKDLKFSTEELTSHATARDLLSHRTGILNYDKARLNGKITLDNIAQELPHWEAIYELRSKFLYNNLIYGLVGHLTQRLSGKQWAAAVQDELLSPLGMRNTGVLNASNYHQFQMPTAYGLDYQGFAKVQREIPPSILQLWSANSPSMGLVSDSIDMGKWLLFHLNKGRNENDLQVVQRKVLEETYRPVVTMPHPRNKLFVRPTTPVTFIFEEYGCAWKAGYYRGYPIITHTGSTHGFSSMLVFIPSRNIGAYLNFNLNDKRHFKRRVLMAYMLDILLGEQPWLDSSAVCTFPAPFAEWKFAPKVAFMSPGTAARALESYVGQYYHPVFGTVNIVFNATEPFLRMFYGPIGQWMLYPNGSRTDTFYGIGEDAVWSFKLWNLRFTTNRRENSKEIDSLIISCFEERRPRAFLKKIDTQSDWFSYSFPVALFLLSFLFVHVVIGKFKWILNKEHSQ